MRESLFLELTCLRVHKRNLLEARVVITSYNDQVRLLSPEPWLVRTTKVYSGVGADIVMESISLIEEQKGYRVPLPLHSATLFPPLLQHCDVHHEEQRHEEARNQYEWETLHQRRVVKRAEQDCIQEIGDAKQVP